MTQKKVSVEQIEWFEKHWKIVCIVASIASAIFVAGFTSGTFWIIWTSTLSDLGTKVSNLETRMDSTSKSLDKNTSELQGHMSTYDNKFSDFVTKDEMSGIQQTVNNLKLPIGTIIAYFGKENSDQLNSRGWIECKGQPVPDHCTDLKAWLSDESMYDVLDPQGRVCVPNLKGAFLRGLNDGADRDPDPNRKLGNFQDDEFEEHQHGEEGIKGIEGQWVNKGSEYNIEGSEQITTAPRGGKETRPKNVAVRFLIKY